MIRTAIETLLAQLGFHGMAGALEGELTRAEHEASPAEEVLHRLLQAEAQHRRERHLAYRLSQARLPWRLTRLIGIGLLTALASGVGSWLFGAPFLTSTFSYVTWPVVGQFELASAMLFDLGVYLTVVGIVLVILERLGDLSTPDAQVTS